jgi:hypothetical protein
VFKSVIEAIKHKHVGTDEDPDEVLIVGDEKV